MKNIQKGLCLILLLLLNGTVNTQSILRIDINTDEHPFESSWALYDDNNNIIRDDEREMLSPFTLYSTTITLDTSTCYRLAIRDDRGDGFTNLGNYKIWLNNRIIAINSDDFFEFEAEHFLNCPDMGKDCASAIPIHAPIMIHPAQEEVWYKININRSGGLLDLNTCLNRIAGGYIDTDLWVYDGCPTLLSDGPAGAIAFNDSYNTCPDAARINSILIPRLQTYYIRMKLRDSTYTNNLQLEVDLEFNILGCTDPTSCNYNPFATLDDNSCDYSDCQPDLRIDEQDLKQSVRLITKENYDDCFIEEGCMRGRGLRQLIEFTTVIENIGNTDYIIGSPADNPDAFSNDNCHQHWHHLGYAEYLLYRADGTAVPIGFKNGFCVLDIYCNEGNKAKYTCAYMGISAGCGDIYDRTIECQWIDVTDIPDGIYTLAVRVNWTRQPDLRGKEEATYDNNWAQVCVRLNRSSGALQMEVIEDCPTQVDCAGVVGGIATIDCNDICGGNGNYGDINQDGRFTNYDIQQYMRAIVASEQPEKCYDLDGNERFSIYDAALLQHCIATEKCDELSPRSHSNTAQNVALQLDNLHLEEGYIDVLYYVPNTKVIAFDFELSVGKISDVVALQADDVQIEWHGSRIASMRTFGNYFPRNSQARAFLRIYFQRFTAREICISHIHDIVNNNYEKISSEILPHCQYIDVLSNTDRLFEDGTLQVYPNPSKGFLQITLAQSERIEQVHLINAQGELVANWQGIMNHKTTLDIQKQAKGLYFIKVYTATKRYIQKVIIL